MSMVFALGVDRGEKDLLVTVAIPLFEKEAPEKEIKLSGPGKNLTEAIQRISEQKDNEVVLGQTRVVVLGEELLRLGKMEDSLDPLSRDAAFPLDAYLLAVKGTAQDFLAQELTANPRIGSYLQNMVESGRTESMICVQNLNDFYIRLNAEGWDPSLPLLEKGNKTLNVVGTALFHDGKMVGNIDIYETQTMLMLMSEGKDAWLVFSDPFDPAETVVIEVRKSRSKVKTRIVEGRPEIDIEVKIRAVLVDKSLFAELLDMETIKKYEESLAAQFSTRAEKLLEKLQNLQTDPIGFGAFLRVQNYPYWQQIGDKEWRQWLPLVQFNVNTELNLRSYGVTTK